MESKFCHWRNLLPLCILYLTEGNSNASPFLEYTTFHSHTSSSSLHTTLQEVQPSQTIEALQLDHHEKYISTNSLLNNSCAPSTDHINLIDQVGNIQKRSRVPYKKNLIFIPRNPLTCSNVFESSAHGYYCSQSTTNKLNFLYKNGVIATAYPDLSSRIICHYPLCITLQKGEFALIGKEEEFIHQQHCHLGYCYAIFHSSNIPEILAIDPEVKSSLALVYSLFSLRRERSTLLGPYSQWETHLITQLTPLSPLVTVIRTKDTVTPFLFTFDAVKHRYVSVLSLNDLREQFHTELSYGVDRGMDGSEEYDSDSDGDNGIVWTNENGNDVSASGEDKTIENIISLFSKPPEKAKSWKNLYPERDYSVLIVTYSPMLNTFIAPLPFLAPAILTEGLDEGAFPTFEDLIASKATMDTPWKGRAIDSYVIYPDGNEGDLVISQVVSRPRASATESFCVSSECAQAGTLGVCEEKGEQNAEEKKDVIDFGRNEKETLKTGDIVKHPLVISHLKFQMKTAFLDEPEFLPLSNNFLDSCSNPHSPVDKERNVLQKMFSSYYLLHSLAYLLNKGDLSSLTLLDSRPVTLLRSRLITAIATRENVVERGKSKKKTVEYATQMERSWNQPKKREMNWKTVLYAIGRLADSLDPVKRINVDLLEMPISQLSTQNTNPGTIFSHLESSKQRSVMTTGGKAKERRGSPGALETESVAPKKDRAQRENELWGVAKNTSGFADLNILDAQDEYVSVPLHFFHHYDYPYYYTTDEVDREREREYNIDPLWDVTERKKIYSTRYFKMPLHLWDSYRHDIMCMNMNRMSYESYLSDLLNLASRDALQYDYMEKYSTYVKDMEFSLFDYKLEREKWEKREKEEMRIAKKAQKENEEKIMKKQMDDVKLNSFTPGKKPKSTLKREQDISNLKYELKRPNIFGEAEHNSFLRPPLSSNLERPGIIKLQAVDPGNSVSFATSSQLNESRDRRSTRDTLGMDHSLLEHHKKDSSSTRINAVQASLITNVGNTGDRNAARIEGVALRHPNLRIFYLRDDEYYTPVLKQKISRGTLLSQSPTLHVCEKRHIDSHVESVLARRNSSFSPSPLTSSPLLSSPFTAVPTLCTLSGLSWSKHSPKTEEECQTSSHHIQRRNIVRKIKLFFSLYPRPSSPPSFLSSPSSPKSLSNDAIQYKWGSALIGSCEVSNPSVEGKVIFSTQVPNDDLISLQSSDSISDNESDGSKQLHARLQETAEKERVKHRFSEFIKEKANQEGEKIHNDVIQINSILIGKKSWTNPTDKSLLVSHMKQLDYLKEHVRDICQYNPQDNQDVDYTLQDLQKQLQNSIKIGKKHEKNGKDARERLINVDLRKHRQYFNDSKKKSGTRPSPESKREMAIRKLGVDFVFEIRPLRLLETRLVNQVVAINSKDETIFIDPHRDLDFLQVICNSQYKCEKGKSYWKSTMDSFVKCLGK